MKKIIFILLIALVVITGWGLGNHAKYEKAGALPDLFSVKLAGALPDLFSMKFGGALPDLFGNYTIKSKY